MCLCKCMLTCAYAYTCISVHVGLRYAYTCTCAHEGLCYKTTHSHSGSFPRCWSSSRSHCRVQPHSPGNSSSARCVLGSALRGWPGRGPWNIWSGRQGRCNIRAGNFNAVAGLARSIRDQGQHCQCLIWPKKPKDVIGSDVIALSLVCFSTCFESLCELLVVTEIASVTSC